jgi:hypothetical protein
MHTTALAATEVFRVQVGAKVHEYPALIAEYGDHLAANPGKGLRSLHSFMQGARHAMKTMPEWVTSLVGWVYLDESGLAYRVSTRDGRHHVIEGAAPAASGELLPLYRA